MRVCLKVPVNALDSFDDSESVNRQVADILEAFDYKTIPFGCSFSHDVKSQKFKQLTLQLSKVANDRLAKYCKLTGKSRTVVLAQVLNFIGKYKT
jgi:hypothetical protein